MTFKGFIPFLALVANLFSRAEPLVQFLNREIWGTVEEKYFEIGLVVQEMWFNVISILALVVFLTA